jgi:hypothetical protein
MPSWKGGEAVTRDEWLSGTDPLEIVNAVAERLTDRKLRLFLVACCRRLCHLPTGPRLREAVEAAERFADGTCGQEEMEWMARTASEEIDTASHSQGLPWLSKAGGAVFAACLPQGYLGNRIGTFTGRYMRGSYRVMRGVDAAAEAAAGHAVSLGEERPENTLEHALADERAEQCRLLGDLVGDPFRPAELHPSWLTWNCGTVPKLAQAIYKERAFDHLPVLADALEETDCDDADILAHCRGPGPHVRGCHVLDRLLAKEPVLALAAAVGGPEAAVPGLVRFRPSHANRGRHAGGSP